MWPVVLRNGMDNANHLQKVQRKAMTKTKTPSVIRNKLADSRCYLAGAMEKKEDKGTEWRNDVKKNLQYLHVFWLDPTCKPCSMGQETKAIHDKLEKDRIELRDHAVKSTMRPVRRIDLRMVDICDFMIVNVDIDVPTFGTHEEVLRAISQNKPVLIHLDGKKQLPLWWYDVVETSRVFTKWIDLYAYLNEIATSKETDEELMRASGYSWMLFDWMGE